MISFLKSNDWWGAPRKLSEQHKDRKVSWLELFYDLVYVIAIAKITARFSQHIHISGFLDYIFFFSIIFWSWLNGSLYYDLHETEGLRTKLMTLWQILLVAALVITTDSSPDKVIFNVTIALMAIQGFITYLWWSIGYYDKTHKRLNRPYTVLYLCSFILLFTSLFLDHYYLRIVLFTSLLLNVLPPFASVITNKKRPVQLNLSSTMSERLGLFAIILFGEVISGIVSGIGEFHQFNIMIWLTFGLSVIIVFALWWLFFTIISDRTCKPGIVKSSLFELFYLPALMALGLISMSFKGLYLQYNTEITDFLSLKEILGYSISLFLLGICLLSSFLQFSELYEQLKKNSQITLIATSALLLTLTILNIPVALPIYLLILLIILILTIIFLNSLWYIQQSKLGKAAE